MSGIGRLAHREGNNEGERMTMEKTMTDKTHGMAGKRNHWKGGRTSLINFRCRPDEKGAWRQQAAREGLKLTDWIHQQLNKGLGND